MMSVFLLNTFFQYYCTILFFISVYLLPMFFLLFYKKQHFFSPFESKLIRAFVITFCINTPFILAFGYAEECRVFTLPLLFLFPVFGKIVRDLLPFSLSFFAYLIHPKRLGFLIGSAVMGWIFFDYAFGLANLMEENFYREYNTISITIISLITIWSYKKNVSNPK